MLEIFFFFFISSFFSVLYGRLFFKLSGIDVKKQNLGFAEQGIFGIILLGFIALFLNFFTKLDQLICTIVLILSLIQIFFEIKSYNQKIIKKFFYHSIIISFFCSIFIAYDNVYRPDAGIYHLPYTKIINDFKIFFGVVTLNPVFGLTNIMQYVSAIFNNYLFKDVGITIPLALLSIYFIEYFVRQILSKKIDIYYKFFLFLIITFIFLEMNRYSEYGNHNPGHLALFYLFTLFFRKDFDLKNDENFKLLTLLCLFIFLNKITFVLVLFIPIAIWLKNKFYLKIKYFPFFSIIFLSIWFLKNLAISGCVVYPVKFTCNDNFEWYSNESKFIIASENIQQFGELHARRWSKINDYKNFDHNRLEKENYL